MFEKILFASGLYLNEEEIRLFSVVWNKDSLPSKDEYLWAIQNKLEKSLFLAFVNLIQENFADFELAKLISNYSYGLTLSLGVEELQEDFQKRLQNTLEYYWAMPCMEVSLMDLDNPKTLAKQLIDLSHLNGMVSDFHERIEVLQKGQSLEEYYLKIGKLEEGESLENIGMAYFDYDNYNLVFADFFDLSIIVFEDIY